MRKIDGKFRIEGEKIISSSGNREIPVGEPLFLLRAKDRNAIATLTAYRKLCIADSCFPEHLEGIDAAITAFATFSEHHPELMKQPGSTRGK